jgi:hypothetical protein
MKKGKKQTRTGAQKVMTKQLDSTLAKSPVTAVVRPKEK